MSKMAAALTPNILSKYNRKTDQMSQFIKRYEVIAQQRQWYQDSDMIMNFIAYLEGDELEWYNDLVSKDEDEDIPWYRYRDKLVQRFERDKQEEKVTARNLLRSRRMKDNDEPEKLIEELEKYCERTDPDATDATKIEYLLNWMDTPETWKVRNKMMLTDFMDWKDAKKTFLKKIHLHRLENKMERSQPKSAQKNLNYGKNFQSPMLEDNYVYTQYGPTIPDKFSSSRYGKSNSPSYASPDKNIGKPAKVTDNNNNYAPGRVTDNRIPIQGNIRAGITGISPEERICFACNRKGHEARNCQNPISPERSPSPRRRIPCYCCESMEHATVSCPDKWCDWCRDVVKNAKYYGHTKLRCPFWWKAPSKNTEEENWKRYNEDKARRDPRGNGDFQYPKN
jgi:hypothetical protein